jgi:hypothetical protein
MQMEQQLIAREDRPVRLLLGIGSSFILSQNSGSQPAIYEAIYPRSRLIDTGAGVLVETMERTANASRISISNNPLGRGAVLQPRSLEPLPKPHTPFSSQCGIGDDGFITYRLWSKTLRYILICVMQMVSGGRPMEESARSKCCNNLTLSWAQVLPRPCLYCWRVA